MTATDFHSIECTLNRMDGSTLIIEFDKSCQIYYSLWSVDGERYFQSELRGDALSLNDEVKQSSLLTNGEKQWLRTTLSIFTKLFDTFEQRLT
jgi:hypothetical protein